MNKRDLKSCTLSELKELLAGQGLPQFRAKQLYQWIHQKLAGHFDEMTNLSKEMRRQLADEFYLTTLTAVDIRESKLDGTKKFLFVLGDGNVIESVWMKYKHGNSVCISSQAGCRMGCSFCASTLDGLARSLTPAEMLDQVYQIQKITGERVANVVVMGSGEPLDNYDHLLTFIRLLCSADGLNLSQRSITVSTCGLVPQMKRLAAEKLQITLALSLHAATDVVRRELMPVAKSFRLDETLDACQNYYRETGRRVTFEYSLVGGVNDRPEDARQLAALLKDQHGHVNLIPVNPIKERDYVQSNRKAIEAFKHVLERNKINVTVRREMGRDIQGACGQLRKSYLAQKE